MTPKDRIAREQALRIIASRIVTWSAVAMLVIAPASITAQEPLPSVTHSLLATERSAGSTLGLFGDITNCTLILCEQSAGLGVNAKVAGPFRVTSGVVLQQEASPLLGARQALARTDVFYESGSASAWIGGLAGRPNGPQSVLNELAPGFESGFAYRWRSVGISAIAIAGASRVRIPGGRHPVARQHISGDTIWYDTVTSQDSSTNALNRWTSAETRFTWRQDRWWVSALLGRISMTQQGASIWGGLQAGADLGRGVTLLLGAGASSRLRAASGTDLGRRNVSLGLGFNTSLLTSRSHDDRSPPPPAAPAFAISNIASGRYRIVIRALDAHLVEFASDCTGWKPVPMTRDGDTWIVELPIAAGSHRANLRADGGAWIAPPGLMTTDDDFAGHVGLFVVE